MFHYHGIRPSSVSGVNALAGIVGSEGKLPRKTIAKEYSLEYGTATIEIHTDALRKGDKVLIVDDLLASGGTAKATGSVVKKLKGEIIGYAF